eukprot:385922_1
MPSETQSVLRNGYFDRESRRRCSEARLNTRPAFNILFASICSWPTLFVSNVSKMVVLLQAEGLPRVWQWPERSRPGGSIKRYDMNIACEFWIGASIRVHFMARKQSKGNFLEFSNWSFVESDGI